jgi:TRAP-type C4-dicarboxylate transport system permease small subunit
MNIFSKILARLVDVALVSCFVSMIIVAFLQVFFRYVLNSPLFASEEIARLFSVWLTFLGSSIAVKHREHITVDIVFLRVSPGLQRLFQLITDCTLLVFNAFLVVEGVELSYLFRGFESHALRFSMSFFFAAVPITAFIAVIFLIDLIQQDTKKIVNLGR